MVAAAAVGAVGVPVSTGEAERTRLLVPVIPEISEIEATRFVEVMVFTRLSEASVAMRRLAVRFVRVVTQDILAVPATSSLVHGVAVQIPTLVPLSKIWEFANHPTELYFAT